MPVDNRFDRAVDIKDVIEFVRSEDPRSKIKLSDGTMTDYIPTKRIALPVNKENAIASGIVAEKDRARWSTRSTSTCGRTRSTRRSS